MTGTANNYGVKIVRLYVDEKKIFESDVKSFRFSDSRMINSFIDFGDWRRNKSFFMKSFIEPGNKLPFFETENNGYITINEERVYKCRYELEDIYGNRTTYNFSLMGKKQEIPPMRKGLLYMVWDRDNHYISETFSLVIPKGNLYTDCIFTLKNIADSNYFSDRFMVNNDFVPLHDRAEMVIKLNTDTLSNKMQYGVVSVKGNKEFWLGGTYSEGYITANIREMGAEYTVSYDKEEPLIVPLKKELWEKEHAIKIKLTDNKSGLSSFKGTIDGQFALFEYDSKSTTYTYKFDDQRLENGKKHTLVFTATDACGNTAEYTTDFYY